MDTVQVGISLFKSGGKLIPGIGAGIGVFDNLNNIFGSKTTKTLEHIAISLFTPLNPYFLYLIHSKKYIVREENTPNKNTVLDLAIDCFRCIIGAIVVVIVW
jgi:hypothetical protein